MCSVFLIVYHPHQSAPGSKEPHGEWVSAVAAALTTQSAGLTLTSFINADSVMYNAAVIYNPCSKLNSINYSYLLCR